MSDFDRKAARERAELRDRNAKLIRSSIEQRCADDALAALDLLDEKDAEIERLKEERRRDMAAALDLFDEKDAEIRELRRNVVSAKECSNAYRAQLDRCEALVRGIEDGTARVLAFIPNRPISVEVSDD
jgi:hypothetical protein